MTQSVLFTLVSESCRGSKLVLSEAEALEADLVDKALLEVLLHVVHVDAIVGALWTRKRWLHS